jgi:predicted small secreted protein
MKSNVKKAIIGLVLVGLAGMAACQTVKGAGQDIQYAGEKTEEAIKGQ